MSRGYRSGRYRVAMPKEQLREMLEALHEEIEHTRSSDLDAQSRELLRGLVRDATELVDDETPEPASLLEQLREATRDFEESHPALAAAANRVATALSNLGI